MKEQIIMYIAYAFLILALVTAFLLYKLFKNKEKRDVLEFKIKDLEKKEKPAETSELIRERDEKIKYLSSENTSQNNSIIQFKSEIETLKSSLSSQQSKEKRPVGKSDLSSLMDELTQELLDESGFYPYDYEFKGVAQYEEALRILKIFQAQCYESGEIFSCTATGLEGSPILKNLAKLSMLAFNSSVELIVNRVRYNNFKSCEDRIVKKFNDINKLLSAFNSYITDSYLESKIKELAVSYEYKLELQNIKDEQAELREQIREEQRAYEEAEKVKQDSIEKEKHLEEALLAAKKEVESKHDSEKDEMLKIIQELEKSLDEAHSNSERAISNAQITSRGHVYIISNIGSFGEGVYKIGMTRRSAPMDRVKELGDASVPFIFDVHAFVYSDNARKLENDLHKVFTNKRVNKVNSRKEFFTVSLEEVESACKKLGYDIKLTKAAQAKEYRESLDYKDESISI